MLRPSGALIRRDSLEANARTRVAVYAGEDDEVAVHGGKSDKGGGEGGWLTASVGRFRYRSARLLHAPFTLDGDEFMPSASAYLCVCKWAIISVSRVTVF